MKTPAGSSSRRSSRRRRSSYPVDERRAAQARRSPPEQARASGGSLVEERQTRTDAAHAGRGDRVQRASSGTRNLLRALSRVFRRQVDVDSGGAVPGPGRSWSGRRAVRAGRHDLAAGAVGALQPRWVDRSDHPRAGRGPQARRLQGADVQHRYGSAAAGTRLAGAGRRHGDGGGCLRPRAVMARDFADPSHLPDLREAGQPAPPAELPRQRNGVTPQMHGRYPDYDVLDEAEHWDAATRRTVLDRVENVPPLRFFTDPEARTLSAFCDVVLAQDSEPKIPVLNMVDAKLYAGKLDGFRYADMPDDRETWRLVARGLDGASRQHRAREFANAPWEVQCHVVDSFSKGQLHGEVWDELDP